MSSRTATRSKEKQTSEMKMVPTTITARMKNHHTSERRQYIWNTFVLVFSAAWGVIILRYNPLGAEKLRSQANGDQRLRNIWQESFLYYQPALIRITQLRTQAQDFVMLQISRQKTLEKITSQLTCKFHKLHLPLIFADPPPSLFLAACLLYAFAIAVFRHAHRKDRYQDFILWYGVVVGLVCAWLSENFVLELKSYLAGSVVLSLALSSLVHRVLGLFGALEVQEEEGQSV